MIEKIKLENFKCFEKIEIDLYNLNVFAGVNGAGKSTIIQSLLLLKQSFEQGYLQNKKICLNGNYVSLGTVKDILFEDAKEDIIKINIIENGTNNTYASVYPRDSNVLDLTDDSSSKYLEENDFEYLHAERVSPQTTYPASDYFAGLKSQLGIKGEYAAYYILLNGDTSIPWDSTLGEEKYIKGALQFWLNEISPEIKLDIQNIGGTDLSQLSFYYLKSSGRSNDYRPTNVGFGVSYVLPVILALIKAKEDSIVIIENPEAHLHPRGQRKMGELISMCAQSGAQIFIETHSDHVLNGIRIAVKNKKIDKSKAGLYFFSRKNEDKKIIHTVENIKIKPDGRLEYWPDGFFDEWDKALDEII